MGCYADGETYQGTIISQNPIQVSLAVRGDYVPEDCREWQNCERRDVSSMRIVGLHS